MFTIHTEKLDRDEQGMLVELAGKRTTIRVEGFKIDENADGFMVYALNRGMHTVVVAVIDDVDLPRVYRIIAADETAKVTKVKADEPKVKA